MNKAKRLFVMALVLTMSFAVGCTGKRSGSESPTDASSSDAEMEVTTDATEADVEHHFIHIF